MFKRNQSAQPQSPCGLAFDHRNGQIVIAEYAADGGFDIYAAKKDGLGQFLFLVDPTLGQIERRFVLVLGRAFIHALEICERRNLFPA